MNCIAARPNSLGLLRRGYLDPYLLIPTLVLISLGFVMVASASFSYAEHRLDNELYFLKRHKLLHQKVNHLHLIALMPDFDFYHS